MYVCGCVGVGVCMCEYILKIYAVYSTYTVYDVRCTVYNVHTTCILLYASLALSKILSRDYILELYSYMYIILLYVYII